MSEGSTLSGVDMELQGSGYRLSLSKKRFATGESHSSILQMVDVERQKKKKKSSLCSLRALHGGLLRKETPHSTQNAGNASGAAAVHTGSQNLTTKSSTEY